MANKERKMPRTPNFMFTSPTKIIFRENAVDEVKREAELLGCKKVMVVTDVGIKDSPMVKKVADALGNLCADVFGNVVGDSDVKIVEEGAAHAKKLGCDGVVSVGGGSSMDSAKIMSIIITKGGNVIQHAGLPFLKEKLIPHIAIPTTAGTGSEVTRFAMIKDHEKGQKYAFADVKLIPDVALLDPHMTVGLPPKITAATGIDALTHAIEAMHSTQRQPISDGLSLEAIKLIFAHLPVCVTNGTDVYARANQLLASTMAALSFDNAMVGIVHALAHAVGGKFGVHHGTANAIFLPHGMRFNMQKASRRYALIGEALGLDEEGNMTAEQLAEAVVKAVEELIEKVGVPKKLSEVGVPRDKLEMLAAEAMVDPSIVTNPRPVMTPKELLPVFEQAY